MPENTKTMNTQRLVVNRSKLALAFGLVSLLSPSLTVCLAASTEYALDALQHAGHRFQHCRVLRLRQHLGKLRAPLLLHILQVPLRNVTDRESQAFLENVVQNASNIPVLADKWSGQSDGPVCGSVEVRSIARAVHKLRQRAPVRPSRYPLCPCQMRTSCRSCIAAVCAGIDRNSAETRTSEVESGVLGNAQTDCGGNANTLVFRNTCN